MSRKFLSAPRSHLVPCLDRECTHIAALECMCYKERVHRHAVRSAVAEAIPGVPRPQRDRSHQIRSDKTEATWMVMLVEGIRVQETQRRIFPALPAQIQVLVRWGLSGIRKITASL